MPHPGRWPFDAENRDVNNYYCDTEVSIQRTSHPKEERELLPDACDETELTVYQVMGGWIWKQAPWDQGHAELAENSYILICPYYRLCKADFH